ncbi:GNAT family N-acetyltransferase [Paenibacillus terricola]|uniref:GNAT family N-acetyltransferase n=1 Tax=Paenibacillus terricola TaxID=2763503 RepID=UPI002964FA6D|nr:GNAT family N-acetyltransferase [Paenibacillus terricola]
MTVTLQPVSIDNWYACTQLNVTPEQRSVFPAPVVYWIAESKFVHDFELRAIYAEGRVVGFLVYCTSADQDDNCWIPALMIDEQHQGKGYGREAMEVLIQLMSELSCKRIMIGHRPSNEIAGKLYESLGFMRVSEEVIDGEIVRLLQLE